jgi:hypothetical protein
MPVGFTPILEALRGSIRRLIAAMRMDAARDAQSRRRALGR